MDQIDEYEQGENVRKWLRQNGSSLITGIALGLACVFAWQWWQGKGVRHQQEAATQFVALTDAIDANDAGRTASFAAVIARDFADSPYSALAALRLAAFQQAHGKTADALATLAKAQAAAKDPDLSEMLTLRLARLQLIAGKPDDARKQLDRLPRSRYPAVADELRGDVAMAQGRRDDARKAYLSALTKLDQAAPIRRLVELKLIDAGGQPPAQPET
jgi:predicted negative regulator of RcsB-dependent stress response